MIKFSVLQFAKEVAFALVVRSSKEGDFVSRDTDVRHY